MPDDCHLMLRNLSWMSAKYRKAMDIEGVEVRSRASYPLPPLP